MNYCRIPLILLSVAAGLSGSVASAQKLFHPSESKAYYLQNNRGYYYMTAEKGAVVLKKKDDAESGLWVFRKTPSGDYTVHPVASPEKNLALTIVNRKYGTPLAIAPLQADPKDQLFRLHDTGKKNRGDTIYNLVSVTYGRNAGYYPSSSKDGTPVSFTGSSQKIGWILYDRTISSKYRSAWGKWTRPAFDEPVKTATKSSKELPAEPQKPIIKNDFSPEAGKQYAIRNAESGLFMSQSDKFTVELSERFDASKASWDVLTDVGGGLSFAPVQGEVDEKNSKSRSKGGAKVRGVVTVTSSSSSKPLAIAAASGPDKNENQLFRIEKAKKDGEFVITYLASGKAVAYRDSKPKSGTFVTLQSPGPKAVWTIVDASTIKVEAPVETKSDEPIVKVDTREFTPELLSNVVFWEMSQAAFSCRVPSTNCCPAITW